MIRIIDNKRIDITDDEYKIFEDICANYPNGKDLFSGLFETNDKGIITLLRPPSNRYTSMEVVIFIQSIMMHQHLRLVHDKVDALIEHTNERYEKLAVESQEIILKMAKELKVVQRQLESGDDKSKR